MVLHENLDNFTWLRDQMLDFRRPLTSCQARRRSMPFNIKRGDWTSFFPSKSTQCRSRKRSVGKIIFPSTWLRKTYGPSLNGRSKEGVHWLFGHFSANRQKELTLLDLGTGGGVPSGQAISQRGAPGYTSKGPCNQFLISRLWLNTADISAINSC